jgi:hypothetical protein
MFNPSGGQEILRMRTSAEFDMAVSFSALKPKQAPCQIARAWKINGLRRVFWLR